MYRRWQEQNLLSAVKSRRAVHLTGARQCGKSTLASCVPLEKSRRYTFDDDGVCLTAESDPTGFVARVPGETVVIDEVQKVPAILNAVKMNLDGSNEKGQYLLTGSSNLRFAKAVKDSLAGRLRTIRLRTLAQAEIRGGAGDFIEKAFRREFHDRMDGFDKREIISLAFAGGYPEVLGLKDPERRYWFEDYLNDILTKDVRDVTEIRKFQALRGVMNWLLAYSSKFFDLKDLGTQCGIKQETAKSYIETLKALYLFDGVDPWSKNDYAKLGRRTKYYASDPSLVANALGWKEDMVYFDADQSGKLIETWVYHELAALADRAPGLTISQYRDSDKREIDFLVENDLGETLGIEVKSGSAIGEGDFTHLRWFSKNLAKGKFTGIVLYSGNQTLPFGNGFWAVPFGALAV